MERPGPAPDVTPEDVLGVFDSLEQPCTPMTATEVAAKLDCSRRTAHRKLEALGERGDVNSKKTGARGRVWWRPINRTHGPDQDDGGRPEVDEFGAFVRAVEDYAIFMLDPDGVVVNWNEGAERIKGYREEQIVGEHFSTFYLEEDRKAGVPERNLEAAASHGRCEDEGWRVREDGSRFWASVVITAIRDDGELQGFTKVTRDLTERREHEQELRRERDFVERVLEMVPMSIGVLDADGEFVRANSRMLDRLGIDESELDRHPADSWVLYDGAGEPIPRDEWPWPSVLETGEPVYDYQCQVDVPNVGRRWLSINAAPLADGEDDHVVVAVDDISDQKEREAELRRERDQTEELLKTAPVSVAVQDAEGQTLLANRRAQEVLGLSETEIIEGPPDAEEWTIRGPDGAPLAPAEMPWVRARTEGEPVVDEEVVIEDPTGERTWLAVNAAPVFRPGGDLERVVIAGDDITALKEHERDLERRKSELETELGEILGRVSDAFYALDEEWRYTHVNERAEEILRTPEEELLGECIWEVFPDVADGILWEKYHEAMEQQEPVSFQLHYEPHDMWEEINAYPSETGLSVYFEDVTERVERERELAKSRLRYRTLVENFPNGAVTLVDEDLRYSTVGGEPVEEAGVTVQELEGSFLRDALPPELAEVLIPRYEAAFEGESSTFEHEIGDSVYQYRVFPVRDDDGAVFAAMGMSQDVTGRKEYERKLEEQREQYRRLVDVAPVAIATYDGDGTVEFANAGAADLAGVPDASDLVGERAIDFIHPDDRDESAKRIRTVLEDREPVPPKETKFLTADGETKHVIVTSVPITFRGKPAAQVVLTDITEQKEREWELERYRTIVETVDDGVYTVDADGRFTMVNDSYAEMTGYPREELLGAHVSKVVDEDVVDSARSIGAELVAGDRNRAKVEADVLTADGGTIRAEATFAMLPSEDDAHERVGVVRDISERVERERALEESERRYRTLAENFPEGIVALYDGDLRYTTAGGQLLDELDIEVDEVIGSTIWERYPDDLADEVEPYFRAAFSGQTTSFEVEYHGLDLYAYTLPVRNAADEIYAGMLVVQDISERKEHERELEARTRQQWIVSDLGQSALENPPLDELFDEAAEAVAETLDVEYAKVLELLPDGDELLLRAGVGWRENLVGRATVDTGLDSQAGYTLRSERPVVVEDRVAEERFSGPALLTDHDVVSGISTIIGPVDDPWGVLGTHHTDYREFHEHDLNFVQSVANILSTAIERKQYERHLDETIEKLEESNERLEQFAYVASHDLQEPLRMISNYLQLLESRYGDDLDEDAEEFIDYAVDGAERMREMIDDLLTYSRVETEADPLEPTDSRAVVDRVLDQLRLQIEETDAEVVVGDLPTVVADGNQLEQVFQNLVSNAIKYRDEKPPRIEIDAEERAGDWLFRVSDNGIGIEPDHVDRIFEVFRRLHTNDEYPGTGIGLALCRKIVERHGGDIWVEAEPGEGSTFYFTVPKEATA